MKAILLLIDSNENRKLLQKYLEKNFNIIAIENPQRDTEKVLKEMNYDLIFTDALTMSTHRQQIKKAKEADPAFLPIILATPRQDIGYATKDLWGVVDALIHTPTNFAELSARLNVLLRARSYSISQKRAELTFEFVPVGLFRASVEGTIQNLNVSLVQIIGARNKAEIIGNNIADFFISDPETDSKLKGLLTRDIQKQDLLLKRTDGVNLWVSIGIHQVTDAKGSIVYLEGSIEDIDQRIRLQQQLIQAQKMEGVGRLAGGVAHDFNNVLTVILNYSELALHILDKKDELYNYIFEIKKAAEHSAKITQQLLAFARKQIYEPKPLDLNNVINGMIGMLSKLIGENIKINFEPSQDLCQVKMDISQIEQIMTNLCINAKDAIDKSGEIFIKTENITIDEGYCNTNPDFVSGDYIMLSISDNGKGMDEDTLKNIFEPFYTTKKVGEGTGLGLSTVYGIVKQNAGFINVYSEPGKGTTFKIYLLRVESPKKDHQEPEKTILPLGNGETVLVVEDEQNILDVSSEILKNLGYIPLTAKTKDEALDLCKNYKEKIDLLLTDIVMPEINGKELSKKIKEYRPEIKVLFMSGYSENIVAHHGVLEEDTNFIQKPFSRKDLAIKIKDLLEKTESNEL